jgi:hypothetical protein
MVLALPRAPPLFKCITSLCDNDLAGAGVTIRIKGKSATHIWSAGANMYPYNATGAAVPYGTALHVALLWHVLNQQLRSTADKSWTQNPKTPY